MSLNIIVYQVESVLVEHKDVAEAAVVPIPHTVKGEALYCFVTMNDGTTFSASTQTELIALIRAKIAPFAMPDYIQVRHFCPDCSDETLCRMRRASQKLGQERS